MVTLVDQSAHGEKPRSSVSRSCRACGESLKDDDENLVRALGETFHTRCFVCEHCHTALNGKFYTVEHRIVCERHYYAHLGLICQQCQQPILDADGTTNYHRSCLVTSCAHSGCNNERCFEWNDRMYCRHHFSLLPETHCASCDEAILKQFVEHHSYPGKRWHPECYMIQKFWNVRLTQGTTTTNSNQDVSVADEQQLRRRQATMEAKVNRIWTELSAYEESSATCISDMLLHVAAGAYSEALRMANQFVTHLQVLFSALELMNAMLLAESGQGLLCFQESRSLCSLVVCFFHLLAQDPKTTKADPCGGRGVRDRTLQQQQQQQHQLNATTTSTQGLLSMVTGIAQNLKALIRIGLTGALKLERQFDRQDAVSRFLDSLLPLEKKRVWIAGRYWFKDEPPSFPISRNDAIVEQQQYCQRCYQLILQDDECYRQGTLQWHTLCFSCVRCNRQLGNDLQKARLGGHPTAEQQRQSDAVTLVLLCSSCCSAAANDYSVGGNFVHVTQLEKSLGLVTTALSRLYATLYYVPHPPPPPPPPATPAAPAVREQEDKLAMQYHQDTKRVLLQDYDVRVNTETATKATSRKRHPSLLRLMGGASRGNSNNRQSLFGSAHLIHVPVKRATSVFEPTTKTTIPTSNRFGTLQRAFSNSNRRRERRSLYGVFDRSSTPNSVSGKQQIQQDEYLPDTASTILSPLPVQNTATITTTTTATTTSPVPRRLSLVELSTIQDTIVRHMAILYVERYASHLYSTEQLLQFVEGKRSSLWRRLKAHIRHGRLSSSSYSSTEEGMRIFGVPLSEAITRGSGRDITAADQSTSTTTVCFLRDSSTSHATSSMAVYFSANAQVPEFVRKCISRLLTMDMTVEGVFRKNGNIRELNELRDAISHDCSFNATSYMDNEESPIQLAALLKRYLRELPEPLLTFRLYNLFIASTRIEQEDATRAKTILHMACCMLPKPHRDTMQLLFLFLKWVASFQAANKMDVHNLACVFAPTIFYSPHASKDTPEERQQGARDEIKVVEMLIHYQDEFCMVPQEFIDVIHNSQAADCFKDGVGSRQALRKLQALVEVRPMEEKSETLSPADDAVAASIVRSNAAAAAGTTNAKRMQRRSWIPGRLVQQ